MSFHTPLFCSLVLKLYRFIKQWWISHFSSLKHLCWRYFLNTCMSRRQSGALTFSVETLHKFAFISNRFGRASFQEIDELSKFSVFFTNLFMVLSHICIKSIMIFKFFSLFIYYFWHRVLVTHTSFEFPV